MSKNLTRVLVLLVLVAFTAGAAQAAPWSLAGPEPSPSFAESLWEWVVSWFEGTAGTGDEGCGMDPDGRCHGVTVEEESGCGMDPNGAC